jgi:hypothetical protein|tara:strand:+ start:687 stop:1040 length:354 start_codon:yes stop_codon:yes gene_type:complete
LRTAASSSDSTSVQAVLNGELANQVTIEQFFDSACSASTFSTKMEVSYWLFVIDAIGWHNHLLEVASDVDFSQVNIFYTIVLFGFSSGAVFVLVWEHPTPLCVVSESTSWQCPNFGL